MTLSFVNENVIPIAISGGAYSLYLNGTLVGKAISHDAVGLPQQSTASLTTTVAFENLALVKKLGGSGDSRAVGYRLDSVLRIDAGDEKLTIKTSSSGAVDLSALRGAGSS